MSTVLDQYLALVTPQLRVLQEHGQKIFPDQHDQELVIRVFHANWHVHLRFYAFIAVVWTLTITIGAFLFAFGDRYTAAAVSIVLLLVTMFADSICMLRVINKQLSSLILTSKRLIHLHHEGLFSTASDIMNFDNLNDVRHNVGGFMQSKVFRGGLLVLKLASGEERIFPYMREPWNVVNIISQVQELYKAHGSQLDMGPMLRKNQQQKEEAPQNPVVTNRLIRGILSMKQRYEPHVPHTSF